MSEEQKQLKVILLQADLFWEDPEQNKAYFSSLLKGLYNTTDLIILPEMFTTGFSMNPEHLAEDSNIYTYLKSHAAAGNIAIYGSVMFQKEEGGYVNRGIFMLPDGNHITYDKRHTFTLAGEQEVYDRGDHPVIAIYKGWKFNLQICYDLRFPVFGRNTDDYDVSIYVANWPVPRINAWDALLKARAIENMAYTIGVNRVGTDGTGMDYNGHSQIYDVLGKELITHPWEVKGIQSVVLEKSHIEHYRNKLKFLQDRDSFTLD